MDSKKDNICKIFAIIVLSMYIGTVTSTNIDCDGKAFHCVNETHFMICVDLGAGVSKTVDNFMIKCPPTTVCRRNNNFECEYQLPTTTQSIIGPGDETNDGTILSQLTTVMNNDIINTNELTTHTNYAPEMQTLNLGIPGNQASTNNDDFEFIMHDVQNNNNSLKLLISSKDKNLSKLINLTANTSDIQSLLNRDEFISPIDDLHSTIIDTTVTTGKAFNLADKEVITPDSINEANASRDALRENTYFQVTDTKSSNMSTNYVPIKFTTAQTTSLIFYPIIKENKTSVKNENIKTASKLYPITQNILLEKPHPSVNITQVDNLVRPEEIISEITTVKQTERSNFNDTMLIIEETAQKNEINNSLPYELNELNINENNYLTTPSSMSELTLTPTDYVDDTNNIIIDTTAPKYNLYDNGMVLLRYNNETAIPVEEFTLTSDEINITSTSNYKQTTEYSITASEVDLSEKNIQEMVSESKLTSLNSNDINTLWPDDNLLEVTSATIIDISYFNHTSLSIPHSTTTSELNSLGGLLQDHVNVNASLTSKRNISEVILEDNISTIDDNIPNFSVSPTLYTTDDDLKTLSHVTSLDSSFKSAENVTDRLEAIKSTTLSSNYVQDEITIQYENEIQMSPKLETISSAALNSVSSRNYITDSKNNAGIEMDMTSVFDNYSTHKILTATNGLNIVDQGIGVTVTESLHGFPKPTKDQKLLPKEAKINQITSSVVTENSNFYDTSVTENVTPTSVINLKEHIIQDKMVSHEQFNMTETSIVTNIPITDTYTRDLSDNTDFTTSSSLSIFKPDFMEQVTDRKGLLKVTTVPYKENDNKMETLSLLNENPGELFSQDDTQNTRSDTKQDIILTSTEKYDPVKSGHDYVNLLEMTTEMTQTHNNNYKNHNDYLIFQGEKHNEKVLLAVYEQSTRENSNNIYGTTEEIISLDKVATVPLIEERISVNNLATEVTLQHQQALNDIMTRKDEITAKTDFYSPNIEILVTDDTFILSTAPPSATTLTSKVEEISSLHNEMNTSGSSKKYSNLLSIKNPDLMSTENNGTSASKSDKTYLSNKSSTTLKSINPNEEVKITNYNFEKSLMQQALNDNVRPILQDQITTETSLWETSYLPNIEMLVSNDKPLPSTPKPLATTLTSKVDEILPLHDEINAGLSKKYLNSLSTENPDLVISTENNGMSVAIPNNKDQDTSSYINDVGLTTELLGPGQELVVEKGNPETELNYSISKGTESTQSINKIVFENSHKTYLSNKSSTTLKSIKPNDEVKITNYNFETSITKQAFNDNVRSTLQDQITTETSLWKIDKISNDKSDNTYSSKQSSTTLKNIRANNEVNITNHNFVNSITVSPLVEQNVNSVTMSLDDTIGAIDNVIKEATPINIVNKQPNVGSEDYPGYINNTTAVDYRMNYSNTITIAPISDSSNILQHTVENNIFHIKSNQLNTNNKDRVSNKRSVLGNTETPSYDTSSKIENNRVISNNKTKTTLITQLYFETNTNKTGETKSNNQTVLEGINDKYLEINGANNILDKQNSTRTTSNILLLLKYNTTHSNMPPTPPTTKESYQPEVFPEISSQKSLYEKFNQTIQNDYPDSTSTNGNSYKSEAFDDKNTDKTIPVLPRDISIVNRTTLATTSKVEIKSWNNNNVSRRATQSFVTNLFSCKNHLRGRFADKDNCRKYYICIGKILPILGQCPTNTVFSEIKKQCTKNLSHCIRNNQFRCIQEGRFSDVLRSNIYYICVNNNNSYVRFQFQCQNGFHLNKTSVRCVNDRKFNSQILSMSLDTSNKGSDQSTVEGKSKEKIQAKEDAKYTCKREGKFPVAEDCRRYYVCSKNSKSAFRRRTKKCDSDEVFHREKKKCVDRDSYECS